MGGRQVCDIVMRSQSFCKLASSVYFTGGGRLITLRKFCHSGDCGDTMNKLLSYNDR